MSNLKPIADLKYKARTYIDNTGKEKGVWVTLGTLFSSHHGSNMSIKLDTVPVGEFNGWISVFNREEKDEPSKFDDDNKMVEELGKAKQDIILEDIDDKPIDLSEIPF